MKRLIAGLFGTPEGRPGLSAAQSTGRSEILTFTSNIGSSCDLGIQKVSLTPGASSCCGGGHCSCCSCCSW